MYDSVGNKLIEALLIVVMFTWGASVQASSMGETSSVTESEYDAIKSEIQKMIESPEFVVLDEASRGPKRTIDVSTAIGDRLSRVYQANKGQLDYPKVYYQYVTKPCLEILSLDGRLDEFIGQNPQFDDYVTHGRNDLPLHYTDMVRLCKQEHGGKRAQGQRRYDEIISRIKQSMDGAEYSVLSEAVHTIKQQSDEISIEPSEALAKPLVDAYRSHGVKCFRQQTSFDDIYSEFVEQPCKKCINFAKELDECLDQFPQIDDHLHSYEGLPKLYAEIVEVCHMIEEEGSDHIRAQFEIMKRN